MSKCGAKKKKVAVVAEGALKKGDAVHSDSHGSLVATSDVPKKEVAAEVWRSEVAIVRLAGAAIPLSVNPFHPTWIVTDNCNREYIISSELLARQCSTHYSYRDSRKMGLSSPVVLHFLYEEKSPSKRYLQSMLIIHEPQRYMIISRLVSDVYWREKHPDGRKGSHWVICTESATGELLTVNSDMASALSNLYKMRDRRPIAFLCSAESNRTYVEQILELPKESAPAANSATMREVVANLAIAVTMAMLKQETDAVMSECEKTLSAFIQQQCRIAMASASTLPPQARKTGE